LGLPSLPGLQASPKLDAPSAAPSAQAAAVSASGKLRDLRPGAEGKALQGRTAPSIGKLLSDRELAAPKTAELENAPAEQSAGHARKLFGQLLGIRYQTGGNLAVPEQAAEGDGARAAPGLKPAAEDEARAQDDDIPSPAPEADHLIYDITEPAFRAGYTAAVTWKEGAALEDIPEAKGFFGKRAAKKARKAYINGIAYRIAELYGDETKAHEFTSRVPVSGDFASLAGHYLDRRGADAKALRENIGDADFVQGYLSAVGYRTAKQVLMPAAGLLERLNPRLGSKMRKRDARFLEGLKTALHEQYPGGKDYAAELENELAGAPKTGTQEFQTKIFFALKNVLGDTYDKTWDEKLHFIPGKVRIPKSLTGLFMGHSIFIVFGIYMHMSAQPYLVYGLTGGSKTMMGLIRNIHFGFYSVSNFLPIGPVIDKTDYRVLYKGTSVVRALLMGAIPLLFLSGHLSFAVLALIVALNPIFQNLMTNADTAGQYSILGEEESVVKEGNAFVNKWYAVGEVLMPLVSGALIGLLVRSFGDPGGYAMAYAVYAAMLLLALPIFHYMVRDPRYHDPSVKKKPESKYRNVFEPPYLVLKGIVLGLKWLLLGGPFKTLWHAARAVLRLTHLLPKSWERPAGGPAKWLDSPIIKKSKPSGDRAEMLAAARAREADLAPLWQEHGLIDAPGDSRLTRLRKKIKRAPSRAIERMARFFDRIETTQGLSVILRSKSLSILLAVHVIEYFLEDALFFVVLPNYLIDIIRPQEALAALSLLTPLLDGIPFIAGLGPIVDELLRALLSTKGGLMGGMLAVSALGGLLGTLFVSGPKGDLRIKRIGHPGFYKAAAIGSLLFWLMMVPIAMVPPVVGGVAPAIPLPVFFGALGIFLLQNFLMRLLHEPLQTVLAPVRRNQIPNDMVGKVSAAMTMIQVGITAAGALTIGIALDFVPIASALFWISIGITLTALLQWKAAGWLTKANPKGWTLGKSDREKLRREKAEQHRKAGTGQDS